MIPPKIAEVYNPAAVSLPGDRLRPLDLPGGNQDYFYSGYHMDDQSNPNFGGYYDREGRYWRRSWHAGPPNASDRAAHSLTAGLTRGLSQMAAFVPGALAEAGSAALAIGGTVVDNPITAMAANLIPGGSAFRSVASTAIRAVSDNNGPDSIGSALQAVASATGSQPLAGADGIMSFVNRLFQR